jgi:hypothetical protein
VRGDAASLAARLAENAEAVCKEYLTQGRRCGNYWLVGDVHDNPGRSLFVRLEGPTSGRGAAGKWTDAATGEHGDLLDLISQNRGHTSLRDTLEEARSFLNEPSRLVSRAPQSAPQSWGRSPQALRCVATPLRHPRRNRPAITRHHGAAPFSGAALSPELLLPRARRCSAGNVAGPARGSDVLGGALQGHHACARLSELARRAPDSPAPWFWDLKAVKVASASFIRECFVAQHAILRAQRSTLYPVIANANADVREDVRVMYKDVGKAIVICRLDGRGRAGDIGLLGHLESYADATFAMVVERGETDARELSQAQSEGPKIGVTAWNNRLAILAETGALIEIPQGRAKRYRPVVQKG